MATLTILMNHVGRALARLVGLLTRPTDDSTAAFRIKEALNKSFDKLRTNKRYDPVRDELVEP
jgi:hypothetical protein